MATKEKRLSDIRPLLEAIAIAEPLGLGDDVQRAWKAYLHADLSQRTKMASAMLQYNAPDWHGICCISSMPEALIITLGGRCHYGRWHDPCRLSGMEVVAGRQSWHNTCMVSGMNPKTERDMKNGLDLKELAWDEHGQEAYEAEMRLRFMMDTYPEEGGTEDKAGKEAGI